MRSLRMLTIRSPIILTKQLWVSQERKLTHLKQSNHVIFNVHSMKITQPSIVFPIRSAKQLLTYFLRKISIQNDPSCFLWIPKTAIIHPLKKIFQSFFIKAPQEASLRNIHKNYLIQNESILTAIIFSKENLHKQFIQFPITNLTTQQ